MLIEPSYDVFRPQQMPIVDSLDELTDIEVLRREANLAYDEGDHEMALRLTQIADRLAGLAQLIKER